MLLLDTCVLSEGVKPQPAPPVVEWMDRQDPAELFISVVSLGELHYGVARMAVGARRRNLEAWLAEVDENFAGRVLVLDDAIARRWGRLRAANPDTPVVDAQIAATALTYGLIFATRNVRHFRFDDLTVVNPWEN
jgi:predicted nucleic acid-binding protein